MTGEDRARLLHAMSTNAVKDLAEGAGVYLFFLNEKGRILADAYLYNFGGEMLLDTEAETTGKIRDHLERFIIADDVELEDRTDSWAVIGLEGPQSIEVATEMGIAVPENRYGVLEWGGGFVARVASASPEGIRIFVLTPQKESVLARLAAADVPNATPTEARIVRIENGIPRYGEEITERYLVQETQALHAVHFNKGCYLGQEIVERIRSRGQVHRLLTPVRIQSKTAPAAGTKLRADDADVAEIASAVYSPGLGEVVALAYVRTEACERKPPMQVSGSESPITARIA